MLENPGGRPTQSRQVTKNGLKQKSETEAR